MKADLHIHTKESDGCLTIEEVLETAFNKDIRILAITDHETTSGVEKAQNAALAYGISVIPGVELSTSYQEEEIHILGYYKNINNDYLQHKLVQFRKNKTRTTYLMVEKLRLKGLKIQWEQVLETASNDGAVCKSHIMYALKNNNLGLENITWTDVASWFKPGGLAYVPYQGNSYQEVIDLIFETGGLPVLAHPGLIKNKGLIKDLLAYKPIGLEVYYGYWDQKKDLITYFEALSQKMALLSTGGSDYHGFFSPVGIGEVPIPKKCLKELKEYLQIE
ncbi:MAG TPA: PHP domain-containing protein [Peptococcaceae bacterium]|nr:PHP domain-containing protein [Peptococcaceae bacterium]